VIGAFPFAAVPIGDPLAPAPSAPPSYRLSASAAPGAYFVAAEIEVYRPGGASAALGYAFGEAPIAALPPAAQQPEDYDTIRAADLGYVSPATDPAGTRAFAPVLDQGFAANRTLDLTPGGGGASASWGAVRLVNLERTYDLAVSTRNVDQRPIRLYLGRKTRDALRGVFVDPPAADLAPLFAGLSQGWQADASGVSISVRDASSWLDRGIQSSIFAGTGTTEGGADLTGTPKPKARGGTAGAPLHVEPVLIDATANIWQWSDAAGTCLAVYEDGSAVFTNAGNAANLWTGSTPAGSYRTDNAGGRFQLGSPRAGKITADVIGSFPLGGAVTSAAGLALALMTEELSLAAGSIEDATFTGLAAAYPYPAGWYWSGAQVETGGAAVARFLASIGARLVPSRSGKLRAVALRSMATGTVPAASYGKSQIVSVERIALPADASPPPYRLRWGYAHNFAVLSTFKPTVTDARRNVLAVSDLFAGWSSATVLAQYRRPSDPAPIATALRLAADAATVAAAMGDLWGVARRLYAVELPIALAVRHEIGEAIVVAFPIDDLDAGKLGLVVGEIMRAGDATSILQILI
jgi:hypothetical protein